MNIDETTALPPPSAERLAWFEEAHRVKLPGDYKAFLSFANGAVPKTRLFRVAGEERLVERFLAILTDPNAFGDLGWYDIAVVITQIDERMADDEDLVGANIVPIAELFAGDFVCLDYRGRPDTPCVVVWNHEASRAFKPVVQVVCGTFAEFLAMLYE